MSKRVISVRRAAAGLAVGLACLAGTVVPAHAQPPSRQKAEAKPSPLEPAVRPRLEAVKQSIATSARPGDSVAVADQALDLMLAYGDPATDAALMCEVNEWRRRVVQLSRLPVERAPAVRDLLMKHPALARRLAYALGPKDHIPNAYRVLEMIASRFPGALAGAEAAGQGGNKGKPQDLTNLIVAFCMVHDRPTDPERIAGLFEYFSTNASKLSMGPETPPDLLAFIVGPDPRVTLDDLDWAMRGYRNHRTVGKLFHTIVYDTNHFKRGTPKKCEQAPGGTNLQNIRKYGGVCVEQAMFAVNVGKAIGVPAVVVSARGSDVGHAWAGYLRQLGGGRLKWDFEEGRHGEYANLRGDAEDPRTGEVVSDGAIALTSGLLMPEDRRELATTLLDLVERIDAVQTTKVAYPPPLPVGVSPPDRPVRPLTGETQLALLEAAVNIAPADQRCWDLLSSLAARRRIPPDQVKTWAERLLDLTMDDSPDYALEVMTPLVALAGGPEKQDEIWNWAAGRFNRRPDLAARAMLRRADLWARNKNPDRAWDLYSDVITRYADEGQVIIEALEDAQRFLRREKKLDQVLPMFERAWKGISKPKNMSGQFAAASTYVWVGSRLGTMLEEAGKKTEAKKVRDQVEQVLAK